MCKTSNNYLLPSRRFFQEHAAEAIELGYLRNDVFVKQTAELNGWGTLQDTPSACYEDWGTIDPVTGERNWGTERIAGGWDKLPNLQVVRNQIGSAGQSLGLWRWDWMFERISEATKKAEWQGAVSR